MIGSGTASGALSGLRVIDLTQMLAGPYATMMLADHGAEVIKVEPLAGDLSRIAGPYADDDVSRTHSGYFQSINRNKHGICLDLKSERGRDALRALARDADILVENFRAGVMDRLGLGYESLRQVNPRLVYGTIRGFGDSRTGGSPYLGWPAFDVVAQAVGGLMGLTGPDAQTPTKVGPGVGDIIPGAMLAFGLLAAVRHAERTGEGQFVDVAMADAVLAVCERAVYQHAIEGRTPGPDGNHHPLFCPFGVFPAADGFVTIATPHDGFFATLCERLGASGLAQDPDFATLPLRARHRARLIAALSALTSMRTKAELRALLGGHVPFGPVNTMADIAADPHFTTREMIVDLEQPGRRTPIQVAGIPIKLTVSPGAVRHRAPHLGEDTRHYLALAGLSDTDIDAMIAAGSVVQHTATELTE